MSQAAEIHRKHALWCEEMAKEYRSDAEKASEPQKSKWLRDAARMEDDAKFYHDHAEMFS